MKRRSARSGLTPRPLRVSPLTAEEIMKVEEQLRAIREQTANTEYSKPHSKFPVELSM